VGLCQLGKSNELTVPWAVSARVVGTTDSGTQVRLQSISLSEWRNCHATRMQRQELERTRANGLFTLVHSLGGNASFRR